MVKLEVLSNTRSVVSIISEEKEKCFIDDTVHLPNKYSPNQFKDAREIELMQIIDSIKDSCGDICKTSYSMGSNLRHQSTQGQVFSSTGQDLITPLQKCVDCGKLWENATTDTYKRSCYPVRYISHDLENLFTYNSTIEIDFVYYNDVRPFDSGGNLEVMVP